MSSSTCDHVSEHRLCYVHCSYCNTILAVSVPCSSLFKIVTVRCGHCTQLLSVNTESSLYPSAAFQPEQQQRISLEHRKDLASSSVRSEKATNSIYTAEDESKILSRETPQKRSQRAPSAYNRFMKEEIQRIKASNPGIRHREAFSAAAKNWAHFPTINFGLMVQNSNIIPPPNMNKDDGEVLIAEVL